MMYSGPSRSGLGMGFPGSSRQEWDSLIRTLHDSSQRDDLKLKALQDIWSGFDVFCNSPTYAQILDNLFTAFLKLFSETAPQFIAENNTQQLRKLMLEIMLRTTTHEVSKRKTGAIQMQMVKLIQSENEENGCLALKILIDHIKSFRVQFSDTSQVVCVLRHFHDVFRDMQHHITGRAMFQHRPFQRPTQPTKEEVLIESYLQTCFCAQKVSLSETEKEPQYLLLPRASQSVKVMAEVPMFFVLLYNSFKNNIASDMNEVVKVVVSFINIAMPSSALPGGVEDPANFHRELADECFNCQMKCMTFLAFLAKQAPDVVYANTQMLISGILNLLEQCPPEMVQARRELLNAVKFFYTSDIRNKFLPHLPRLLSEKLMIGSGYTCQDILRPLFYHITADLLHHLRLQLPYPILCHAIFVFSRCVHDVLLPPNMQSICIRLMMNLCEAFSKLETNNGDPCRDFLFHVLESCNMKMKSIAHYHLPLLFKQHGNCLEWNSFSGSSESLRKLEEDANGRLVNDLNKYDSSLDQASGMGMNGLTKSRSLSVDTVEEFEPLATHQQNETLRERGPPVVESPARESSKLRNVDSMLAAVWAVNGPPIPMADCRNQVKFMVTACKFVVQHMIESKCKRTNKSMSYAEERDVFVRLVKYGMMCLDVFMLPGPAASATAGRHMGGVRSRDEKDCLDCFASIFTFINIDVFQEIFSAHMDFLIERISRNYALQLICNSFLVNPNTSAKFGGILVNYLLRRLPLMSENSQRSNLHLKLYKLMFSAVSCAQSTGCNEIERMLKPYMHDMVSDAVRLALNSSEPQNYFLLLRALFRSIGGGAHDMLYAQFLPLLPALLKKLNRLQSCAHRQQMRELFTELCLTIPVRLSSLLPYLPLLMDPLVSALHGSGGLMQQGLRTLELCVDNLQPEYLYEHMAPVRAPLMQGLWSTVATASDYSSAQNAMRILGKLGGSNRKMLVEPQMLKVLDEWQLEQVCVRVEVERGGQRMEDDPFADTFPEEGQPLFALLGMGDAVRVAVEQLRNSSIADSASQTPTQSPLTLQLRANAAELARSVIMCGMSAVSASEWNEETVNQMKEALKKAAQLGEFRPVYKCPKEGARNMFINAITALFFAVVGKDLRNNFVKFFNAVVKQLSLQSLLEQIAYPSLVLDDVSPLCMDSCVLVDAIVLVLSDLNSEFANAAIVALRHIIDALRQMVDDEDTLVRLPFLHYIIERICSLCHGPSWYSRLGAASALRYIIDNYPLKLIKENCQLLLDSLLEIHFGLLDEVSSGAMDMASTALSLLAKKFFPSFDSNCADDQKTVAVFVECYTKHIFTPNRDFRNLIFSLLNQLSSLIGVPVLKLLGRRADYLTEQLTSATARFGGDSLNAQAATMEVFCLLIGGEEQIVKLDKGDPVLVAFVVYVCWLCEQTESSLIENVLYRPLGPPTHHPHDSISKMIPLRQSAAECLVSCYIWLSRKSVSVKNVDIGDENMECEDEGTDEGGSIKADGEDTSSKTSDIDMDIAVAGDMPEANDLLRTALKLLGDKQHSIQLVARDALLKAVAQSPLPSDVLADAVNTVLLNMEAKVSDSAVRQLLHLSYLDPSVVDERAETIIRNQLLRWDGDCPSVRGPNSGLPLERTVDDMHTLLSICHLLAQNDRFGVDCLPLVCSFIAKIDFEYCVDRPLKWENVLLKFLCKHPLDTIYFFISKESISNPGRRALIRRLIKPPEAAELRKTLTGNPEILYNLLEGRMVASSDPGCREWLEPASPPTEQLFAECELLVLCLIDRCSREDPEWFADAKELIEKLRQVWKSTDFKLRHLVKPLETTGKEEKIHVQMLHLTKYKVPKLVVTCMLRYLRSNYNDMELLFEVMTCFIGHYVTDFTFVRQFLEKEVIPVYPIEWRRQAFFMVMDKFLNNPQETTMDLGVVKVLQYLIIPCIQYALERFDVDKVVGPLCISASLAPGAKESDESQKEKDKEGDGEGEEDAEKMDRNIVVRFEKVINQCRKSMSDRMMVVTFQLATVFVQHAPQHIHDNSRKQGQRLRSFMLLAWPCLNQPTQDVTIKFSAHLLLAYIVEKFTINRKIVLQVYHSLMTAYATDNRDVVKKAIDVITPAVPVRMEDGYGQLLTAVKKVLSEETHNQSHIYHCIYMVCRNYRVYYHVRHDILPSLLGALNKLTTHYGMTDGRRLALEVCEMVIKWDLLLNQRVEQSSQDKEAEDDRVESVLEKLKATSDKESTGEDEVVPKQEVTEEEPRGPVRCEKDLANSRVAREHAEYVVSMLLRLATTPPSSLPQNQQPIGVELNKRSMSLLRAALKPVVWGETVALDLKLSWLEKHLMVTAEQVRHQDQMFAMQQAAHTLDVIVTLVQTMPPHLSVKTLEPLQKAITACLKSGSGPIIRIVNSVVSNLMKKTKCSSSGLDELDELNKNICTYIAEQFNSYEKTASAHMQVVYMSFSLLRIIGSCQPGYIDQVLGYQLYLNVLGKLAKEHVYMVQKSESKEKDKGCIDVIIVALELLRPTVGQMGHEKKKHLAHTLALLCEKSDSEKVIDACMKMVHSIVTTSEEQVAASLGVNLMRLMMKVIDIRFKKPTSFSQELMKSYLETLLFVYDNPVLRKSNEFLNDSFYWGLYFAEETLRNKFLAVWERDIEASALGRLHFTFSLHNWTPMRDQFWLRHAVFLLLKSVKKEACDGGKRIRSDGPTFWRTLKEAVTAADVDSVHAHVVTGSSDVQMSSAPSADDTVKEEVHSENGTGTQAGCVEPKTEVDDEAMEVGDGEPLAQGSSRRSSDVLEEVKLLLAEACHTDMADAIDKFCALLFNVTDLSLVASVFTTLFCSIWSALSDRERSSLEKLIMPFLSSGIHLVQASAPTSVLSVLLDTFSRCNPPIRFDPYLLKYISARHRSWHRGLLLLEEQALLVHPLSLTPDVQFKKTSELSPDITRNMEVLDSLYELYCEVGETDQMSVVWDRRAFAPETVQAVAMYSKGQLEDTATYLETLMGAHEEKTAHMVPRQYPAHWAKEQDYWIQLWSTCTTELSRWTTLRDFANSSSVQDSKTLMKVAMHLPDWQLLREARDQLSGCIPPSFIVLYHVYSAMLAVVDQEVSPPSTTPTSDKAFSPADRSIDDAFRMLIEHWRALPSIVDQQHIPILQSMCAVQEIYEASPVMVNIGQLRTSSSALANPNHHMHLASEMKNVIKTWRNRCCTLSDDMSFVVQAQHWRLAIHSALVAAFDQGDSKTLLMSPGTYNSQQLVPMHSAAQAQLVIAQAARATRLYQVAEDSLARMHTLPLLPNVDAQVKIIEQIKLYRTVALDPRTPPEKSRQLLLEALVVCDSPNLAEFAKEQLHRIIALKGSILSKLNRFEEAECAFSAAASLQDQMPSPSNSAVPFTSAFKSWGKHIDAIFHRERTRASASIQGLNAVASFMEAARHDQECKAAKYIASLLWTAKWVAAVGGEDIAEQMDDIIRRHAQSIVPVNWIQWLPSLVLEVRSRSSTGFLSILSRLAQSHPQPTFYAIRSQLPAQILDRVTERVRGVGATPIGDLSDLNLNDWQKRLVEVVEVCLSVRPADVRALHRVLGELSTLPEYWAEKQHRLAGDLVDAVITVLSDKRQSGIEHATCDGTILTCVRKWTEELKNSSDCLLEKDAEWPASHEKLDSENQYRRDMCDRILAVLSLLSPGVLLQGQEPLLPRCIELKTELAKRIARLPKTMMLSAVSPYLAGLCARTANVELFSELFTPRAVQYLAMTSRFNARVHVEVRGGRVVKRIEVRAHSGKIFSYISQKWTGEKSVGRLPHLQSHFNSLLQREPETCRRFLRSYTPVRVECGNGVLLLQVPHQPSTLLHPADVLALKLRDSFLVPDELTSLFFSAIASARGEQLPIAMLTQYSDMCGWVSPWCLQRYVASRVTDPTHYYSLRKQLSRQLGLLFVQEMSFSLTSSRMEHLMICIGSSLLCNSWPSFSLSETASEPTVRYTLNMQKLVSMSQDGHLRWSMVAAEKCMRQKSILPVLRTVLWDEIAAETGIGDLEKADRLSKRTEQIMNRFASPVAEERKEDVFSVLARSALPEVLCRSDPASHPWF